MAEIGLFARIKQMNDKYTGVLAGGYSIAFFVLFAISMACPSQQAQNNLGRVTDGEMLILGYYFGSSVGSRNKDHLLADKKDDEKK